jgi:hypothetical protein
MASLPNQTHALRRSPRDAALSSFGARRGTSTPRHILTMLCSLCTRNLELRAADDLEGEWDDIAFRSHYPDYDFHQTAEELSAAAAAGCYVCSNVTLDSPFEPGEPLGLVMWFWWALYIVPREMALSVRKEALPVAVFKEPQELDFQVNETITGQLRATNKLYPELPPTLRSNEVCDLACLWYRTCRKEHPCCGSDSSVAERPNPPRLLDLMKDPVELALGKQLDTGTEYAVLSHCWGLIPFTTLTQERLSCFMQDGIADEILPANFLDAIWMCRQLQIRYLWIDSLCIVQSRFRHLSSR